MCLRGAFAGKCMLASAACDNMDMCVGENHISDCSKLEAVFFFLLFLWYGGTDTLENFSSFLIQMR